MAAGSLTLGELVRASLAAVRARIWIVLLLAGLVVAANQARGGSDARLLIGFHPGSVIQEVFGEPHQGVPPPTAAELISLPVRQALAPRVAISAAELSSRLRVEQSGTELDATLVARGGTARAAVMLVNEWAASYIQYRQLLEVRALDAARREINQEVVHLRRSASLVDRRRIIRSLLASAAARAQPPDAEVLSLAAVRPVKLPLATALVAGLGLGLIAALLAGAVDGRLRTPATAAAHIGAPVLATLGGAELAASVDAVRNFLVLRHGASLPRLTLFVPSRAGDETSLLARAYAERAGQAGYRVALLLEGTAEAPATPEEWRARARSLLREHEAVVVGAGGAFGAAAAALTADCDAWLLVLLAGRTTGAQARAAVDHARAAGREPTGAVMIRATRSTTARRRPTEPAAAGAPSPI